MAIITAPPLGHWSQGSHQAAPRVACRLRGVPFNNPIGGSGSQAKVLAHNASWPIATPHRSPLPDHFNRLAT